SGTVVVAPIEMGAASQCADTTSTAVGFGRPPAQAASSAGQRAWSISGGAPWERNSTGMRPVVAPGPAMVVSDIVAPFREVRCLFKFELYGSSIACSSNLNNVGRVWG